jgi:dihydrofolate reductase
MHITIVVTMSAREGVIGKDGQMPDWHLPSDLDRFRRLTLGGSVIRGRPTWDSVFERNSHPLAGRKNIVLTRSEATAERIRSQGGVAVLSPQHAIAAAENQNSIFVIGGAEIYEIFVPMARRMFITRVYGGVEGNIYFPLKLLSRWKETHDPESRERRRQSIEDTHGTDFRVLVRR